MKQSVIITITLISFVTMAVQHLKAQQNNTLFSMQELPQANIVNPSLSPSCKFFISFPIVGSTHLNAYSSGFSLEDMFEKVNKTTYSFKPYNSVDKFNKYEIIASEFHLSLISLGYKFKNNYFTFYINEKINTYALISKNMALLVIKGNSQFEGENTDIGNNRINGTHYREYVLGWSREINNHLKIGIKSKFIFGKGNIYNPPTTSTINTNTSTFNIDLYGQGDLFSSFPLTISKDTRDFPNSINIQDNINMRDYLFNTSNKGISFDFGITHQWNELYTISASLLDIGFIKWNSSLNHFYREGSFTGNASSFQNGLINQNDLLDTLNTTFRPLLSSKSYTSPLIPNSYIGINRYISEKFNLGFVYHLEYFKKKIHPSYTLAANLNIFNNLFTTASYTIQNHQFNNFGFGIGAKLGPVHFHAISDNILAFSNLTNTRNINLRFGLSLIFGCQKDKKVSDRKTSPGALPCYNNPYTKSYNRPKR